MLRPNPDRVTCFESLSLGPSAKLNLYSPATESVEGQLGIVQFVDFARKQISDHAIQNDPKQMNVFLIS